jgi:S1-C subfamily serine protease
MAGYALFLLVWTGAIHASPAEPEKSVVKIITFSQRPVWNSPWRSESVRKGTGSGFVIQGKRIMTNAHVVGWDRQILLKRHQDPELYPAKVEFIGHDCDLALLQVEDERFFEGLEPLDFGELPQVRSVVTTYGYPAGGEQISYTQGVVSRIEVQSYVHIGNRAFLSVQTDAAINPGNSGGPVIQGDRVVGVAFQGMPGLENTGFFIPPPVIRHFLDDIKDGVYNGFPQAGIRLVPLQNPAYRRYLKLPEHGLGAKIDSMLPIETTRAVLKEEDVILQVGDFPVASDGTILYKGNRVHAAVAFHLAQHGETVSLRVWRDGEELTVAVPVYVYEGDRASGNQHGILPRYFVYSGLVFTPLSLDYLRTAGRNRGDQFNAAMTYELFYRRAEDPDSVRPEPVVLAQILADEVNANFSVTGEVLVDKINGIRIESLDDVVEAIENNSEEFHVIEFLPDHSFEALHREAAAQAHERILKTYGILHDRRL